MSRDDFKFVTWAFTALIAFYIVVGIFAGWVVVGTILLGTALGVVGSTAIYYFFSYANKLLDFVYERWINRS